MESQPQNPEFRNNPENFHPCYMSQQKVHVGMCTQRRLGSAGASQYSDQSSKGAQWVAKGPKVLTTVNKDCDQTVQIDFNLHSTHMPTCMLDIRSYLERKRHKT